MESSSIIDKRHASRSVRCVIWKKRKKEANDEHHITRNEQTKSNGRLSNSMFMMDEDDVEDDDGIEKFALKMIMRRKNIKSNLNEKNIMLAMDSEWHTKLINT